MSLVHPSPEQFDKATSEEIAQLAAECLSRLNPGKQPLQLFSELARLTVLSNIQLVPFRAGTEASEVLLGKRPEHDIWWPNQWEIPGVVLLPTDIKKNPDDYERPVRRVLESEFQDSVARAGGITVFDAHPLSISRGTEQVVYCWTEVELTDGVVEPSGGAFFDIAQILDTPPQDGLIEGHAQTLESARSHYLASQR